MDHGLKSKLETELTTPVVEDTIMKALCDEVRADIDYECMRYGASDDSTDAVRGWLKTKNLWIGPDYNG